MAKKFFWTAAAVTLCLTLGALPATAQGTGQYIYTVSFECGFQTSPDGSAGYEPVVKVANYALKLDVFNYGSSPVNISAQVHGTGAQRWASSVAPVQLPANTLQGGDASMLDCVNLVSAILGSVPTGKPFYSGIVTLRSPQPLIVWATKTTEVCAGLATYFDGDFLDPLIFIDQNGIPSTPSTGPLPPARITLFGCPNAVVMPGSPSQGQGPYLAPGGAVPPGLRPIGMMTNLQNNNFMSQLAVSHSLDFERVEGVFVP